MIKFGKPCIYTIPSTEGQRHWKLKGIKYNDDYIEKFIVTDILSEDIPYIKDQDGVKHKLEVSMIITIGDDFLYEETTLDKEEEYYWQQFIKIKRI